LFQVIYQVIGKISKEY